MSATDLLAAWQAETRAGRLTFPRCGQCGGWNWYPLAACRGCGGTDMQMVEVPPWGRVFSWTRVHRSFTGTPAAPLPYVTVVVDVAAAPGVRLVCLQQGDTTPVIDAPVALVAAEGEKGAGRWLSHLADAR